MKGPFIGDLNQITAEDPRGTEEKGGSRKGFKSASCTGTENRALAIVRWIGGAEASSTPPEK